MVDDWIIEWLQENRSKLDSGVLGDASTPDNILNRVKIQLMEKGVTWTDELELKVKNIIFE